MPNITSSLGTSQTYIPAVNSTQIGKFAGLHMHFPSLTALNAAVTNERANIAASSPVWTNQQVFSVANESAHLFRVWDSVAQHARRVIVRPGLEIVLTGDTNTALTGAGAPVAGAGANGDISVDFLGNTVYVKSAGAWSILNANLYAAINGSDLITTAFNPAIPLDSTSGREMGLKSVDSNIVLSIGSNAVLNGNCNLTVVMNGVNTLNVSAFSVVGDIIVNTLGNAYEMSFLKRPTAVFAFVRLIADVTAPTFTTASVNETSSVVISATYSEALVSNGIAPADITVSNKTVNAVVVSGLQLQVSVSPAFTAGDAAATISIAAGKLKDVAGNLTAAVVTRPVANNLFPSFTAQTAPGGIVGVIYNYQFVAPGATSFVIGTGSLPAGLTLSSMGLLSGVPLAPAGTATFTVNAINSAGTRASSVQSLIIVVASSSQVLRMATGGGGNVLIETGTTAGYNYTGPLGFVRLVNEGSWGGDIRSLKAADLGYISGVAAAMTAPHTWGTTMQIGLSQGASGSPYEVYGTSTWAIGPSATDTVTYWVPFERAYAPYVTTDVPPGQFIPDTQVVCALGDVVRVRKSSTTQIVGEVSKDNGVTWTTVKTWAVAAQNLYGTLGVIDNTRWDNIRGLGFTAIPVLLDNFNRGNGNLGSASDGGSWTQFPVNGIGVGNSMAYGAGVEGHAIRDLGRSDGVVQSTLFTGGNPPALYPGLMLRGDGTNQNFLIVGFQTSGVYLYSMEAGVGGTIGANQTGATIQNVANSTTGQVCRVEFSGNTITAKIDGVVAGTWTSSLGLTRTWCGLSASPQGEKWEDWSAS